MQLIKVKCAKILELVNPRVIHQLVFAYHRQNYRHRARPSFQIQRGSLLDAEVNERERNEG